MRDVLLICSDGRRLREEIDAFNRGCISFQEGQAGLWENSGIGVGPRQECVTVAVQHLYKWMCEDDEGKRGRRGCPRLR